MMAETIANMQLEMLDDVRHINTAADLEPDSRTASIARALRKSSKSQRRRSKVANPSSVAMESAAGNDSSGLSDSGGGGADSRMISEASSSGGVVKVGETVAVDPNVSSADASGGQFQTGTSTALDATPSAAASTKLSSVRTGRKGSVLPAPSLGSSKKSKSARFAGVGSEVSTILEGDKSPSETRAAQESNHSEESDIDAKPVLRKQKSIKLKSQALPSELPGFDAANYKPKIILSRFHDDLVKAESEDGSFRGESAPLGVLLEGVQQQQSTAASFSATGFRLTGDSVVQQASQSQSMLSLLRVYASGNDRAVVAAGEKLTAAPQPAAALTPVGDESKSSNSVVKALGQLKSTGTVQINSSSREAELEDPPPVGLFASKFGADYDRYSKYTLGGSERKLGSQVDVPFERHRQLLPSKQQDAASGGSN